jgi:peptidoglycan L-alanyl-D-glutamate endopeptidase CwlK
MTWRQIVDRSHGHIEKLAPTFRDRVGKWYAELLAKRIPVLVYCSVRTPKEQDELYAIGRSKKGTKVTNARGTPVPQSFHCYGRAIDAVPCGLSSTGQGYVTSWTDEKGYQLMRNCAEKYDLRWLSWETPHFEDGEFKDWRELAASESIGTRVAEANRRYMQEVESTPGGIPWPQNTRVSKSATKPVRRVGLRKP